MVGIILGRVRAALRSMPPNAKGEETSPLRILFCYHSMNAFANRNNINDLEITQVRFGGDVFLQPRSERFAKLITRKCKQHSKRDESQTPQRRLGSPKREPGKGPGKKRGGRHIGPAAGMDGESAFAGIESCVCFPRRIPNLFRGQITEQKKTGRVGVSRHAFAGMFVREQMDGGVLERVIAPRFENEWKIKDHGMIIS